jgi:formylglycine-generating enzyme required for sulfatase activity
VGVTFLEETFAASTAPPPHRLHQKAAQAVLKALLPEAGTDIKGTMRSHAELLEASGYASRQKDYDDLMRILDGELRLITPTDPESADGARPQAQAGAKYYQLTHDYLVPSLRDWLTRKEKETRRGRAELLLADRAAVWNDRPESRQLPSLVQWLQIRWYTRKKTWTPPQRKMMRKATRYHVVRGLVVAVLLALLGLGAWEGYGRLQAHRLRDRLLEATTADVPGIVHDMAPYRRWLDPLLREAYDEAKESHDLRKQLHASLALLPADPGQVDYLYGRLLDAEPPAVFVIRDALAPHKAELLARLWGVMAQPAKWKASQRLRVAAALATYAPHSEQWARSGKQVVDDLVSVNPYFLALWSGGFRPVKEHLTGPLVAMFRERKVERATERTLATDILADFAAGQPQLLAALLRDADEKQYAVLCPKLQACGDRALAVLVGQLNSNRPAQPLRWTVRFHRWQQVGDRATPAGWQAVLRSPVLDEVAMSHLFFSSEVGLPTKKVPDDYFATVATSDATLSTGTYQFSVIFDDGVRLWLDDKVVFENWGRNGPTRKDILVRAEAGRHTIKVEHFQIDGAYALGLAVEDTESDSRAKQQANAAVALLRMRCPERVWPLLRHSPDPSVRSYLIASLAPLGADVSGIVKRLHEEPDVTIRRALVLSLGAFGEEAWQPGGWGAQLRKMRALYRTADDPGLHAALEWLLRQPLWAQAQWLRLENELWATDQEMGSKRLARIKNVLAKEKGKARPQWYVNGQGQTMVVIPGPVEFLMGSVPAVGTVLLPRLKRIERSFAIAAKPVTVREYLRYRQEYDYHKEYAPDQDCPVHGTTWHMAAAYCNWLSKQEAIPEDQWCYEISPQGQVAKLKENYLSLTGYRLPTEAEWEFACRAGAVTSRHYGESDGLLGQYAWYVKNSSEHSWPVGSKRPNDLGLFDMHGNVWNWCQDKAVAQRPGVEDVEDDLNVTPDDNRACRGGAFDLRAPVSRSGSRGGLAPGHRNVNGGFRPARTIR